ncbi:outer membrane lipoprotein carrier protein LolA [Flavobacterium sp. PLA-1-15]|uniref:outer membrane lipoprotein carrier protein LolA n=1 Tax=Flavobacterium sp. PLA-1-15 TaxID=3380533 RepID=UPI003B7E7FF0
MKTRILLLLCCMMNLSVFSQEQKMSASEIASFKATVEKEAKNIKSLKTDFVQYKHLDFLSKDIETSGKMYFKQPNLLNWQYTKPYQYSIVFKNNKVYINDQGNKSTVDAKSKMFEKINKLIVGSVSGNMFDDKEFTITYFKNKDFNIVKLTPKTAAIKKYINQIDLHFPMSDTTVSEVKLTEPSGDFTRIVFKNKQLNAKIDDAIFTN